MKLSVIIALFSLSAIVKGAWLAAAAQPVILTLGAILGALDLDILDFEIPFINKQEKEGKKEDLGEDEKGFKTRIDDEFKDW